uniref:Putative secreted protein n=1 Tax=Anopheles marajoara TaxID=58244 RepID=A0A2M4CEM8_9DIPT
MMLSVFSRCCFFNTSFTMLIFFVEEAHNTFACLLMNATRSRNSSKSCLFLSSRSMIVAHSYVVFVSLLP